MFVTQSFSSFTVPAISADTALDYRLLAPGEHVARRPSSTYQAHIRSVRDDRRRVGFQLMPWRSALEQNLGRQVSGLTMRRGKVDWNFGRKRGLGL